MIEKVLTIGVFLFLSQSLFVICKIWEPQSISKKTVCRNEECLKRGKLYFENLSPAVNPCDDFYSFVCGAWYMQHRPPNHAAEWTVHDVMENRLLEDLRDILAKPVGKSESELKQVKYFYDLCMNQPFYDRKGSLNIANEIIKAGRFGKKHLWDIHQAYLKLTGESAFFDYQTLALHPKEFVPVLVMRELVSPYGAALHNAWKPEEEENYEHFLFKLMKSLGLPDTDLLLHSKVKAVIKFRHQFNVIILQSRKRRVFDPKFMSSREFEQSFKLIRTVKQAGMPWERIIKRILSVMPKTPKPDMKIITAHEVGYFRELNELLNSTSEEILVDHMEMYFAERHTVFTTAMEDLLEMTSIEPTDLMEHLRADTPRWETCIRHHNMWAPIGKILQEKWFRKNITEPMTYLINGIKLAIAEEIKESTWLDGPSKVETIKRIIEVEPWIGYPPAYSHPSIDIHSENALNDPMRAEAYLNLQNHVIFIKSPLLRTPYFNPGLPNLYNYGAIGFVVGHELYHVIDECGMYVSLKRRVRWWPTEMRNRCYTQIKCFTEAYANETQRELQLKYHETTELPTKKTYLEDFPDVMGLDAAFHLYKKELAKDSSICQTLPRFENYSCEQMFFISFANTLCGKVTSKAAAKHHIETSKHSLDSVRVNGAVQNSQFFHKAFNCPQSKPMNPPVKCNLWK